jgi:glycosidase
MADPENILKLCIELYGEKEGPVVEARITRLMERYRQLIPPQPAGQRAALTQRDAILITYGDQVRQAGVSPLQSLAAFCEQTLPGRISGVHILPFFPYSSDDGFSVIDYKTVDPALGSWNDVARLGQKFRLMFDAVINHASILSQAFQSFLKGDPKFSDFFITVDPALGSSDLSKVVRPRTLPLLTHFETAAGVKAVWTTFSADQVDLNFHNPAVLLEILDVLLFYAARGAEFIRLDAIAYLWKEIGTSCIHLPQTHAVIRLFRAILDQVAPQVLLITETNVPHPDNISYFGDGANEAQLVYNFALPPLVLHSLRTGSGKTLSQWASRLQTPSPQTAFFNFLASHDGIGLNPARGILADSEIDTLVQGALAHGGLVSYKQNPDGTQSPYELNINYFDALSDPTAGEPEAVQVDRFMVAHAIMLAQAGLPGIYFHSLFGSRGWPEGVHQTGRNRTINRQKLERSALELELGNADSRRHRIFDRFSQLLRARASCTAFHPSGEQRVLACGDSVFGLLRTSPDGRERAVCLHNLTALRQPVVIPGLETSGQEPAAWADLAGGEGLEVKSGEPLLMKPYQIQWWVCR